jgi:hypothetical protein
VPPAACSLPPPHQWSPPPLIHLCIYSRNRLAIEEIFIFSKAHPAPIQCESGSFPPGVKSMGREIAHSSPTIAEVKNGGAISPRPHTSS